MLLSSVQQARFFTRTDRPFSESGVAVFMNAILEASIKAKELWKKKNMKATIINSDGTEFYLGIREIPGSEFFYNQNKVGKNKFKLGFEVYVLADANLRPDGVGLLFFAETKKISSRGVQTLYAVASNKAHKRSIKIEDPNGIEPPFELGFFEIIDTEEDRLIPNKTAMRAVSCTAIAPNATCLNERRVYALQVISPEVEKVWDENI